MSRRKQHLVVLTAAAAAAALLLTSCAGGDGKERKAALTTVTTPTNAVTKDPEKPPPPDQQPPRITSASDQCSHVNAAWIFQPSSFEETRDKAKHVVEAQVVAVEAGAPLGTPSAAEPGDSELIPTQKVTLSVTKGHKGSKKAGDTIELFQTGSACFQVEHDPLYKKGEQYVLMLDDGPSGMLKTVSPEGRYKKMADGTLDVFVDNDATKKVKGKKVKDIESALEGGKLP